MNKQQQIPDGWKWVRLKDLSSKIGSGVTPKGGSDVYLKNGVKFLRSQNVLNGTISFDDIAFISDETNDKMKSTQLKKGDVLYNITGASIGRSAVYDFDEPANVNQHVCIIRLKDSNPKLINTILLSSIGKQHLFSFQAGGNRQGLNYQQLGSFEIPIPPIPEQIKIVQILETWDKYLKLLDKKINIKKNIKKGLMQCLLSGNRRSQSFVSSWHDVALKDIASFHKGENLPKSCLDNNGKNECILYGELFVRYKEYIENIVSRTNIDNGTRSVFGDILIPSSDVTPLGLGTATAVLKNGVLLGGDINIIRPEKNINSVFLSYLLNYEKRKILRLVTGTTIRHVYLSDIKKIKLTIPDIKSQTVIANILIMANREIVALEKLRRLVVVQKKYLLNNLITGQIRVPEFASHN